MKADLPPLTITVLPLSVPGHRGASPMQAAIPVPVCGCGRTMRPALRSLPNRADTTY